MKNALKRFIDISGALVGIVLLSPVWLIIILWIWLDSGRPVFFLQQRLGKHGRPFSMYKFRSMVVNAESMGEGLFSYEDDKRITTPGRYIRAMSLDELPQLINILMGEMSIVGPRPPVTYELGNYADFDARLKGRFVVKPGLTGLAQISGRNALTWDQKIEYDLRYIARFQKYGILEDIRIIFSTIGIVVLMRNTIEQRPEGEEKQN
jgi:lipopolysaccharide/colanic/teichoic acid biosynthesis glycosyltransferase